MIIEDFFKKGKWWWPIFTKYGAFTNKCDKTVI